MEQLVGRNLGILSSFRFRDESILPTLREFEAFSKLEKQDGVKAAVQNVFLKRVAEQCRRGLSATKLIGESVGVSYGERMSIEEVIQTIATCLREALGTTFKQVDGTTLLGENHRGPTEISYRVDDNGKALLTNVKRTLHDPFDLEPPVIQEVQYTVDPSDGSSSLVLFESQEVIPTQEENVNIRLIGYYEFPIPCREALPTAEVQVPV